MVLELFSKCHFLGSGKGRNRRVLFCYVPRAVPHISCVVPPNYPQDLGKLGGPVCSYGKLELKDVVLLEAAQLESSRAGRQESHLAVGWRGLTPKT